MQLMQRLTEGQVNQQQTTAALTTALAAAQHGGNSGPKERLPKLSAFGGNRSKYEGWEIEAHNKLDTDGQAIGNEQDKLRYIFASLEGDAQAICTSWVRTNQDSKTGKDLLDYLNRIYSDPNKKRRAMNRLATMEQKANETFPRFLSRFEAELANASAGEATDNYKIALLERALNREMQDRLQSVYPVPEVYTAYIELLQTLSSRAEAYKTGRKPVVLQSTRRDQNAMDWEPTPRINTGTSSATVPTTGRRAKWVSKEVVDYRMKNQLCLRCGRAGHRVNKCSLRAAAPPARVNVAEHAEAQAEDSDGDSEDSGKE